MAETLLMFGVEKLWDLLVRESERFEEVGGQFSELKRDLNKLRCFLEDADAKKHTSAMVRNTVKEVKEIVYDTEDIIETFLLKQELGKASTIKNIFSCIIVKRMKGISFDMKVMSMRISKVIQDMQSLGVQQIIVNDGYMQSLQERQRQHRQTFCSDKETVLVGFEENVKKLVAHLVEENNSQVVSITGMGGIGKTTLARQVFNHKTLKSRFERFAWVCVSQQFTRKYVWQTILRKIGPEYLDSDMSHMTEDQLQENLFKVLTKRTALIVLDDIWREQDWNIIEPVFPLGKGWKVLLTSRNESVAFRADPNCFTIKPDFLTFEESWTIFQRIVFPGENTTEYKVDEEMEEVGKQMIKHCGGLPLAVKVLSGLLVLQYTLRDWERIHEDIRSHIVGGTSYNDENISSVYHILYLSFEELPIYLKHCFLYLVQFPEDFEINVKKLSHYWAAEGISRPRLYSGATIRELGDGYIEELVKRNMVISERDIRTTRFEKCHLHDMMREVGLRKAEEENFLQIFLNTSKENSKFFCKARRLTVQHSDVSDGVVTQESSKLRSLLFLESLCWKEINFCFTRLQLIRVLDISRVRCSGNRLPSSIGLLIHLRYLSLYHAEVHHLPSSMRNLKMLIYLNLCVHERCSIYMPNFLKEMQELLYLSFPLNMEDKVKLELGNLVNLETLENFPTAHANVRDLQGMIRLRALSIYIRNGCTVETLSLSLSKLRYMEKLTIYYYRQLYGLTNNDEGLVLDCVHLKQLKLRIYMPRLPDRQHFPSHLTNISLTECCLKEDPMPILEKLLHLIEVTLSNRSFCGKRMVCSSGGFPQLRKLDLGGLEELQEWAVQEGSMLLLDKLTIRNCPKLKEVPDGLKFITSLKELNVILGNEEVKKKLSRGGEEYYKVQHIPLVQIQ